MRVLGQDLALVVKFVRNFRGGSQPILAQASDGLLYVVKFTNNLQGAHLPFNECIGTELYKACGLSVPPWKRLLLTDQFIDQNPNCWMQTDIGPLRPKSGLCFGSRFLGEDGGRLLEILPQSSFQRIRNFESFWLAWMIDICAEHTDNRQAIFLEDGQRFLRAFFIDHGHLFGGPQGKRRSHFSASRYLDCRVYQDISPEHQRNLLKTAESLNVEKLWRQVQRLPDDWKSSLAISGFERCLSRLSNSGLLLNVVDTMVDAYQRGFKGSEGKPNIEQKFNVRLSGIQASLAESVPRFQYQ